MTQLKQIHRGHAYLCSEHKICKTFILYVYIIYMQAYLNDNTGTYQVWSQREVAIVLKCGDLWSGAPRTCRFRTRGFWKWKFVLSENKEGLSSYNRGILRYCCTIKMIAVVFHATCEFWCMSFCENFTTAIFMLIFIDQLIAAKSTVVRFNKTPARR